MSDHLSELSDDDRQDSDYDGAWKEALRSHLRRFIEKFFPRLAVLINWSIEPEWLDKEISQVIGQPGNRNREVDVLFRVHLMNGDEQWILCHLEIQTSYEADFAVRVDQYNSGLKWLFRREVLTLVILADLRPDWRPSEYQFELAGFESHLRFPVCKVLDQMDNDWAEDTSLPVQVVRAQIAALRTAGDPEARFYAKTQLVRNLYKAGYNADELREIFRIIDWMMHLRRDLSHRFDLELSNFEKEQHMPYVTSIERNAEERGLERGLEEGLERGREQGSVTLLLRQLTRLCGSLPADVEQQIGQLALPQSQSLGEALLDFQSLADLRTWLAKELV